MINDYHIFQLMKSLKSWVCTSEKSFNWSITKTLTLHQYLSIYNSDTQESQHLAQKVVTRALHNTESVTVCIGASH